MRRFLKAGILLAALALVAVTAALATPQKSTATDTLVFGASADPVVLDAALISDGESFRVLYQMVETLVDLSAGHDQDRAGARDELEEERRRPHVDVQPPPGCDVPRRHAVQRSGRVLQLQPLVQLQGRPAEPGRVVLLRRRLRRLPLRDGLAGPQERALPELPRGEPVHRRGQAEEAVRRRSWAR